MTTVQLDRVPTRQEARLGAWRNANPHRLNEWKVKAGHVVQFGGWKMYYGRCVVCDALLTDRRCVLNAYRTGAGMQGRWRANCDACNKAKRTADNAAAKHRMRRLRAERARLRAEDDARLEREAAERRASLPERELERRALERRQNGLAPE